MNIRSVVKLFTHPAHLAHPFTKNTPAFTFLTSNERIKGCALFALASIGTLGILGGIYIIAAIWKSSQRKTPLDKTIEKIDNLAGKKKLCLFVGRAGNESIPPSTDQEEWISLDHLDVSEPDKKPLDRIHLVVDFNDQERMQRISGLFDRVVLDGSTMKFINGNPWRMLGILLRESPASELITETDRGFNNILSPGQVDKGNVDGFINIPYSELSGGRQLQYEQENRQRTKAFLQQLFHEVTLVENQPFPYPTRFNVNNYFVLRNPKKALAN